MVDELSKKLEPVLRAHGVQLAYLFGSQATGQAGPLSDFDVGVLFANTLSPQERFRRRLSLLAEVIGVLRVQRVDVVVLNEAPPALRFRVIQYGKILYNQDETVRVRFEAKTMSEYFDTQPLRDLYRQRLFEAITAGRFYD
jgi:predicted nucleotidyltransferase